MIFPSARHWFSSHSKATVIPTAITAGIGLWSVISLMSEWQVWLLSPSMIICVIIVWLEAAKQDLNNSKDREKINDLLETIIATKAVGELPIHLTNLRLLKPDDIRRRVYEIAKKMRAMENGFRKAKDRFDDIDLDFKTMVQKNSAQNDEQKTRWNNDLRPEALALWDETRRRIYGTPPYPDEKFLYVTFQLGILAGPEPLNDAATELERLAREIPG